LDKDIPHLIAEVDDTSPSLHGRNKREETPLSPSLHPITFPSLASQKVGALFALLPLTAWRGERRGVKRGGGGFAWKGGVSVVLLMVLLAVVVKIVWVLREGGEEGGWWAAILEGGKEEKVSAWQGGGEGGWE